MKRRKVTKGRTSFQRCMSSKLKGRKGRGAQTRFAAAARACSGKRGRRKARRAIGW
jgi:hypothetical protein